MQDRYNIYNYWFYHNKSISYSEKLEFIFNKTAVLISEFTELGTRTDYPDIRVTIVRQFKIFYRINQERIEIVRVWDTRQNPEALNF